MPTNKNALLRYQILDRCFSDRHRYYEIEDLVEKVNEAFLDLYGTTVSLRQIRADITHMRDRLVYDAPIEAVSSTLQPDEEEEDKQRLEGRMTEAKVLRRQRNRQARQQCLEASGYNCYICGFDFEKTYGEIGKGFLEVHHKRPISTYDEEHEIPQSELVALCSNCHSMVHRRKEAMDVDELKNIVQNKQNN